MDGFGSRVQGLHLRGAALDGVLLVEGLGLQRRFLRAWLSGEVVFAE
jgi:hypothetical protein